MLLEMENNMNDVNEILSNIKAFPKIGGALKQATLFDFSSEKEKDKNNPFKEDYSYSSECDDFIKEINKAKSEFDFLLLSWDLESTGLIEGWKDKPSIILCSFALFGLKGEKTELFYSFETINMKDVFVTSSIKEIEEIFKISLSIDNLIFYGWNISGFDHLLIEEKLGAEISVNLINLLYKNRLYDGYLLSMLQSIAIYGDLKKKFGLNNLSQYYLGIELEKSLREDFIEMNFSNLKETHVDYSLKDSIVAGYIFFKIVEQSPKLEEEILEQLNLLGTLDLAKKSGFLSHNNQYLANYSLMKVGHNGHEVDYEKIRTLC
jgi:hypothetical protein